MYDYGNKFAEKWTEDSFSAELEKIVEKTESPECYFILAAIKGVLTKGQYDYLQDRFKESHKVTSLIKTIQGNCEQNLVTGMLTGKIKETGSIFLLKAKYGYKDRQTIEHEVKGSINVNVKLPQFPEASEE